MRLTSPSAPVLSSHFPIAALLFLLLQLVCVDVVQAAALSGSDDRRATTEHSVGPVTGAVPAHERCIDDDNVCPRGCPGIGDIDCEILERVELAERFLRTRQKGNLYTPDPREDSLGSQTEVYRLLYGSQATGYLQLYAATGKTTYLKEATERLEALLAAGDAIWSDSRWDGDLAFAFLRAYELTGNEKFFGPGIAVARRLVADCDRISTHGLCDLNWGMSAALCLIQAYRITGEDYFRNAARLTLARTQLYQHEDGSLPHQADLRARNLLYSSWVAFQLFSYLSLDPEVIDVDLTIIYWGRVQTLDVERMLSRLVSFLERQTTEEGQVSYTGYVPGSVFTECVYCSNLFFWRCEEYCGQLCDPQDAPNHPCECMQNPIYDCPRSWNGVDPDPVCVYCSNAMYASCASVCQSICEPDSIEFPCYCISDPEQECPRDSILVEVSYFDDWAANYDTRGWTSELASTVFALARGGAHETKWKMLDFLLSLQNEDGSFPDKWGYRTEVPGTLLWLWASGERSVMRTSIIFRVLSSLLVPVELPELKEKIQANGNSRLKFAVGRPAVVEISPNPSSRGVTFRVDLSDASAPVGMRIVDVAGRVVAVLSVVPSGSTVQELQWNGRDGAGERVSPGVYFAQVFGNGWRSTKKLVILGK